MQVSYQRKLNPIPALGSNFTSEDANGTAAAAAAAATAVTRVRETRLDHYKLRARIDVSKDDVQKVVPIVRHPELVNLAVLTGRQVSRPLKVFIVSQAGQVADVTLRSSCSSKDDSVVKVREETSSPNQ